jgi:hypothetical protein
MTAASKPATCYPSRTKLSSRLRETLLVLLAIVPIIIIEFLPTPRNKNDKVESHLTISNWVGRTEVIKLRGTAGIELGSFSFGCFNARAISKRHTDLVVQT